MGSLLSGGPSVRDLERNRLITTTIRRWIPIRIKLFPVVICAGRSQNVSEVKAMKLTLMLGVAITLSLSLRAQNLVVLHEFTGGIDGASPSAGLTMDRAGNFYGSAALGGNYGSNCPETGCGTVFKIKYGGTGWVFEPLYAFKGGNDSNAPYAPVTIGSNGTLYGTTTALGCAPGFCPPTHGTVFNITPSPNIPANAFAPWPETVLYTFGDGLDGAYPETGGVVFDAAGNIYGATPAGGGSPGCPGGCGTVYQLSRSGDQWSETILYTFIGASDGNGPQGVTFDNAGNLYGITSGAGAYNCGTVFKLTPTGSGWAESTIYTFNPDTGDGCNADGGLTFDGIGTFYGTNYRGANGGTAFELSPDGKGGWTETVIASFGFGNPAGGGLTLDSAGNFYGVTGNSAYGSGTLFKLARSGGRWTYTTLWTFGVNGGTDLSGNVTLDATGNIYGTSAEGGLSGGSCPYGGCGLAWEYMP